MSSILHLTDLLPGVVLVVSQDVTQRKRIISVPPSFQYNPHYKHYVEDLRYSEMFNIIKNVLTKYVDVILH